MESPQMTLFAGPAAEDPRGPEGSQLGAGERPRDGIPGPPLECARPGCRRTVPPQARGGSERRYCSDRCQRVHWNETHPRVPKEPKAQRRAAVFERLRQGRATGWDLVKAGGGTRYGARVAELRGQGLTILGPMSWTRPDGTRVTETLPKTDDGWPQYELRD